MTMANLAVRTNTHDAWFWNEKFPFSVCFVFEMENFRFPFVLCCGGSSSSSIQPAILLSVCVSSNIRDIRAAPSRSLVSEPRTGRGPSVRPFWPNTRQRRDVFIYIYIYVCVCVSFFFITCCLFLPFLSVFVRFRVGFFTGPLSVGVPWGTLRYVLLFFFFFFFSFLLWICIMYCQGKKGSISRRSVDLNTHDTDILSFLPFAFPFFSCLQVPNHYTLTIVSQINSKGTLPAW